MADTLYKQAYAAVDPETSPPMLRRARLETFAKTYCELVAHAAPETLDAEARVLNLPVERIGALDRYAHGSSAEALAEILRLFGSRVPGDVPDEFDRFLDDLLGPGGREGTLAD